MLFAIPYDGDFTLIGATELDYAGDPSKAAASEAEIDYLCAAASEYFARQRHQGGRRLDLFRGASAL